MRTSTVLPLFEAGGGFTVQTDWRSSDQGATRRHLTSHPPQVWAWCRNWIRAPWPSHKLVRIVNEHGIGKDWSFLGGGAGEVKKLFWRSRGHLHWLSMPQTQKISPVKSLIPQSMPSHLSFSSQSCYLIHDALPVQSNSSSWILITISIVSGYLCPDQPATLPVVFLKNAGKHAHKKFHLYLCVRFHTRFDVHMLSPYQCLPWPNRRCSSLPRTPCKNL